MRAELHHGVVPPAQKEQWLHDRKGALVGDVIASKMGWKVGDTITLSGSIYPGDWQFQIDGIYSATRKVVDRSSFFFHWDYLNDSLPEGDRRRDQIPAYSSAAPKKSERPTPVRHAVCACPF